MLIFFILLITTAALRLREFFDFDFFEKMKIADPEPVMAANIKSDTNIYGRRVSKIAEFYVFGVRAKKDFSF